MLISKNYYCGICLTKPDQLSHHKLHLNTQKHKDKKTIFEFTISKLSNKEKKEKYNSIDNNEIIKKNETIIDYNISQNINLMNNDKIDKSNNISSKEALKEKIHKIHNYLRNNGAGYGMNALKVFNIIYGLKKIKENNLLDKVKLCPECDFTYLLDLANKNENEKIVEVILGSILLSISKSIIREFMFYNIPKNIKGYVLSHLIKEIDKITLIEKTCNVQLSGKIYEYFIGRDATAISELGAYFTDRHIVNYIYQNKLQPTINDDGTIPNMIDMFGGSGGFTTGYINYLNENNEIDWTTELSKVYHYDMNEDVIKSAALEFFCITGELPNMKYNLHYKNSMNDEFDDRKFKYIITNPPYGGDKNKISESQMKRNKIKDYIKELLSDDATKDNNEDLKKQLKEIEAQDKTDKKENDKNKVCLTSSSARIQKYAKKNNLKGNDKESISLILMMDLLDIDGTCIGVLKEGVFFNRTYAELRKCLIINFNVREVISIPSDQFENTSTKTSIIIFDNTKVKTTNVKFYDLVIERYKEDKFEKIYNRIELIENKDDIKNVLDILVSEASKEELLDNYICSLNSKDYNKKEIMCSEDYKLVKLGDISEINLNSIIDKNEYNYVEISDINENVITNFTKLNKNELPINAKNIATYGNILISCVRPKKSKMTLITKDFKNIENYIFSLALANIKLKDINLSYYVYGILYNLVDNFEKDLCIGSSYPRFKGSDLKNIDIPIPKSEEKLKEWVDKISKPYDKKIKKEQQLKELEIEIQNKIKNIIENENCNEVELESIIEIKSGEYITKANMISGIYPVYGGGNISNYINKYNRENQLIINKDGVSLNCIKFESDKFFLNHHGWTLEYKDITLKNYINKWLFNIQEEIYNLAIGSAQKGINRDNFLKLKIKIPKNKDLINNLEPLFNNIKKLQTEIKENEILYNKFIQELSNDFMLTNSTAEGDAVYNNKLLIEVENKKVSKVKKSRKTKI